jgi:hypothetical protein
MMCSTIKHMFLPEVGLHYLTKKKNLITAVNISSGMQKQISKFLKESVYQISSGTIYLLITRG